MEPGALMLQIAPDLVPVSPVLIPELLLQTVFFTDDPHVVREDNRDYKRCRSSQDDPGNAAQGFRPPALFWIPATNFFPGLMDADGTNAVNLTNHPAKDGAPVWSPDGTKIAFWSERQGIRAIYVMKADGR